MIEGEVWPVSRDPGSSGLHCGDRPVRAGHEGGAVEAGCVLGADSDPWRPPAHHRYSAVV